MRLDTPVVGRVMGGSRFRFRVIFGWIREGGVLGRLIYCRVCHALYFFYFVDELIDEF